MFIGLKKASVIPSNKEYQNQKYHFDVLLSLEINYAYFSSLLFMNERLSLSAFIITLGQKVKDFI